MSNEKFQRALKSHEDPTIYTLMFKSIILTGWGEALKRQGLRDEAREQFNSALRIYQKMGNITHADRVAELISRL